MAYSSASWVSPPESETNSVFARPSTARSTRNLLHSELRDYGNVNEAELPPPVPSVPRREHLEEISDGESTPRATRPTHGIFPKPSSSRGSPARGQEQGLSEVAGPAPVESSQQQLDQERQQPVAASPEQQQQQQRPPPQQFMSIEPPPPPASNFMTDIYTISYLIFFSIWGTLARLGLQWLTFYPGSPIVTPVVWANFGGSLIMGFLAEDQALFRDEWLVSSDFAREKKSDDEDDRTAYDTLDKAERAKRKKVIPLYVGLATGFCGSFTSFSSFARDFFLALSNNLPTPIDHPYPQDLTPSTTSTADRNGGYSFLAFVAVVAYTIALSLGGLILGGHIALSLQDFSPKVPIGLVRKVLDPLMVFLAFGCWLGALLLAIFPPDRPGGPASRGSWMNEVWRGEVLFALVFAPVGCVARWYISLKLNSLVPAFPLGTFTVNMFGTAVEGMCWDIQHVGVGIMGRVGGGRVGCQVLQGVQDGFCGCLTTISTWVAEINALRRRHGYAYCFSSVAGALGLMVVIMGSVRWTVGWAEPVCNTGYTSKIFG